MFIVPLMLIGLASVSCNSDDEGGSGNNSDVIVGSWKISSIVVDDTDIYPAMVLAGVCEIEDVTHFHNDHTITTDTFQENADTGDCEPGPDGSGTWSKEGNAYTVTLNGEAQTVTPEFSDNDNKFTVAQEFEGQFAMVTFSRQ